jgi:hypothetical protein
MDASPEAQCAQTLKIEHTALERLIEEENARPRPDDTHIAEMKRRKLRIKDQLFELERQSETV